LGIDGAVGILTWLFAGLVSLAAGYGVSRLIWGLLVMIRLYSPRGERCVVCDVREDDLYVCDACGRCVCSRHVFTYKKGAEQELIQPDVWSVHHYERERTVRLGHWCPYCDGKHLIAILAGIVFGDTAFLAIMWWVIFHRM
jgi:hypothetical protein